MERKKNKKADEVRSKLRLLSICDAEDGAVLFEKVWKWLKDRDSSIVGNLVRSFFQIAKQLDHGMVSRVVFEHEVGGSQTEVQFDSATKTSSIQRMQMLCTRNDYVVVSLFFDMDPKTNLEDHESNPENEESIHNAMRQYVEQARELYSRRVSDAQFDRTLNVLLNRTIRALITTTTEDNVLFINDDN